MVEKIIHVSKKGKELGGVDRYIAHTNNGVLHKGFMIVVKNPKNQIYIAKRAGKRPDLKNFPAPFPYQWDGSIAGHPRFGGSYFERMCGELEEELGLKAEEKELKWVGEFYYNSVDPAQNNYGIIVREKEICGVAIFYTEQEPKPDPTELDAGEWIDAKELKKQVNQFIKTNIVTKPNGHIDIKEFTLEERMFTPWLVKAHLFYPQIYAKK